MYLFGSQARRNNRLDSDIDIFVESETELAQIPKTWLIYNGGPVDAFWMPSVDGWADAIGTDQERQILCWDKWGALVDPILITVQQLTKFVNARG